MNKIITLITTSAFMAGLMLSSASAFQAAPPSAEKAKEMMEAKEPKMAGEAKAMEAKMDGEEHKMEGEAKAMQAKMDGAEKKMEGQAKAEKAKIKEKPPTK
ncbi:MAG: hypothetical protein HOJ34_09695 [Kordiimonadaceae bacterium]|jgi:Skp family chaperone for outer membrane proteins|nr:hypothetical protein [Kordiimonadaceae bacterium]MBT6035320.1 hypothetical protein [Kordiimonadaceae bacterium]MBT6330042.1 hypothetical protein [Kordiimonadaceae bacterium]